MGWNGRHGVSGDKMSGLRKGSTPSAGALLRQYGGDGSFLPIEEVHPREFADMAGHHPGAARKIRGRLEGARLLTIGPRRDGFTL